MSAATRPGFWTSAGFASLVLALSSGDAEAHMVTTGLGPVYDGVAHFVLTPEDIIPVVGLAVLTGLRGAARGRGRCSSLAAFWLIGGAAGLLIALPANEFAAAISLLLVGGLVAADAPLSSWAVAAVAAIVGAVHGYVDGASLPGGSAVFSWFWE